MSITRSASAQPLSRRRALLLAGVVPLAVAGCGTSGDDGGSGGTREVDAGRGPVEVPAQPRRVVSLSGALTGYLYTLEAPVTASDAPCSAPGRTPRGSRRPGRRARSAREP